MSYYEKLISAIEDDIENLLIHIANKYNLNQNELMDIWKGKKNTVKKQEEPTKPYSLNDILYDSKNSKIFSLNYDA